MNIFTGVRAAFIGVLFVILSFCTSCTRQMPIALEGRPRAVVVVAGDATEPEKHAAAEQYPAAVWRGPAEVAQLAAVDGQPSGRENFGHERGL